MADNKSPQSGKDQNKKVTFKKLCEKGTCKPNNCQDAIKKIEQGNLRAGLCDLARQCDEEVEASAKKKRLLDRNIVGCVVSINTSALDPVCVAIQKKQDFTLSRVTFCMKTG